jgi:hypothetical protein
MGCSINTVYIINTSASIGVRLSRRRLAESHPVDPERKPRLLQQLREAIR